MRALDVRFVKFVSAPSPVDSRKVWSKVWSACLGIMKSSVHRAEGRKVRSAEVSVERVPGHHEKQRKLCG